jgi:hypothetical protein
MVAGQIFTRNSSASHSLIVEYAVPTVPILSRSPSPISLTDGDHLGNTGGYFASPPSTGRIGKSLSHVAFRDQPWTASLGAEQFLAAVPWKEMGCCTMQVREKKLSLFSSFPRKLANWDKMRIGRRSEVLQRASPRHGEVCDIVVDWRLLDCSVGDARCEGQDWYHGCTAGYGLKR